MVYYQSTKCTTSSSLVQREAKKNMWLKVVENQVALTAKEYKLSNTLSGEMFFLNQTMLVKREIGKEYVETLQTYLGETKKPNKMKINPSTRKDKIVLKLPVTNEYRCN